MPVIRLGFLLYGVPKGPVHQRHRRRHPAGGEAATAPETMAMVAVKGVRAPDGDGGGSMAAVTATRPKVLGKRTPAQRGRGGGRGGGRGRGGVAKKAKLTQAMKPRIAACIAKHKGDLDEVTQELQRDPDFSWATAAKIKGWAGNLTTAAESTALDKWWEGRGTVWAGDNAAPRAGKDKDAVKKIAEAVSVARPDGKVGHVIAWIKRRVASDAKRASKAASVSALQEDRSKAIWCSTCGTFTVPKEGQGAGKCLTAGTCGRCGVGTAGARVALCLGLGAGLVRAPPSIVRRAARLVSHPSLARPSQTSTKRASSKWPAPGRTRARFGTSKWRCLPATSADASRALDICAANTPRRSARAPGCTACSCRGRRG